MSAALAVLAVSAAPASARNAAAPAPARNATVPVAIAAAPVATAAAPVATAPAPVATAPAPVATAAAPAATAAASCRSYPRPGTIAAARVPRLVLAEYAALRRTRRPADSVPVSRLGRLPESGILPDGIRLLGTVPAGGRAYLSRRCTCWRRRWSLSGAFPRPSARQASLLVTLRREYAHQGLCVAIVYRRRTADDCSAAPGTVAPLLHGPGGAVFGVVPDGIDAVTVSFRGRQHPARVAFVHGNFWELGSTAGPAPAPAACGLDWLGPDQTVLRTVRRCTPDRS